MTEPSNDELRSEGPTCGHPAPAVRPPVCDHLRECREPWLGYHRWFIGVGIEHELLCSACTHLREEGGVVRAHVVCANCLEYITDEVGDLIGARGSAEIREIRGPLPGGQVTDIEPPSLPAELTDLSCAVTQRAWYGLCADGSIVRFGSCWRAPEVITVIDPPADVQHDPFMGHELRPRLHVSPSGTAAAVVNDYGRYGLVVALPAGEITMSLDGGEYHPETVPFSLCFASVDDHEVLVHRTAWNRLDVSDPITGALLTDREPTSYRDGEERPEHYLDYFHGRLYGSPNGEHLLDDGWVWHPVGVPEAWSLRRWLEENPWESEDGPTKRALTGRDYYWDHGMSWLDNTHVAIEGIGEDDEWMIPGVRIFDVTRPGKANRIRWPGAVEVAFFAGPNGALFGAGRLLFSSDRDGLAIWDVERQGRLGSIPGFRPQFHDRSGRELVELSEGRLRTWRYE